MKRSFVAMSVIAVLMLPEGTAAGQEPRPGGTQLSAQFVKDKKPKKKPKPKAKPNKGDEPVPAVTKNDPKPKETGDVPPVGPKSEETGGPKPAFHGWTREMLLAYINAQPAAFRPRLLAIANTKDQNRLAKMAIEDPDLSNRAIATHTLTDQKLLAKVAGESKKEEIRVMAVRRLTGEDQPSLLKLIEQTQDSRVRGPAIALVKDPTLRAKLERDANPAGAAYDKKLEEEETQKLLTSKNDGDRLRDLEVAVTPTVLFKCAMQDPDSGIGEKATKRLIELRGYGKRGIEDTLFEELALGAKSARARRTAVSVVTSQAILAKAAKDTNSDVRSAAAARLDAVKGKKK